MDAGIRCEIVKIQQVGSIIMIKNKSFKKAACALMAAGIGVAMTSQASATTLRLAIDAASEDSPAGRSLAYWGEKIEEYSDGELSVDVYYQSQLGGQQEVFELLMGGSIDGMLTWPMTTYDRRIGIIWTPYMLTSWDDALEAYSEGGWLYTALDEVMEDNNLRFLGSWPDGFTGISTTGQCVTDVERKNRLTLRTVPVYPMPQAVQALGYQTTSIDWSELYTALQTGVVDGDAGNVIYHIYNYFDDLMSCYVRTSHMFATAMFLMNSDSFDSLSSSQQEAVVKASNDAMRKQFDDARDIDAEYVEKAIESGMKYEELSEEELRAAAIKVREEVWPSMESEIGSDLMKVIIDNASEI